MKKLIAVAGLALQTAGCVLPPQGELAMTCTDFIGKPISDRIAAFGPPQTVVRLSPTRVGYTFVAKTTTLSGGAVYYTTNYLVRVDKHRTPVYAMTTTCRGTFIVRAPSDATPLDQRIIVDVVT
ncbi:hypothetical protein [Microvirga sp. 2TAF3]|uniref:hypothetical protein n=1 Tax=Microvirga sp. 2TAF3 TaxID=3233014 RepID=UPI003F9B53D5